jgi:SAM-dependent methyltransferase
MSGHTVGMDAERGDDAVDPGVMPRVSALVDSFLTDRSDRTSQAYAIDLDDFATFLGATRAGAATRLLTGGPNGAWHLVLEYAIDLRRRDRAPTTIDRRLNTLRALVRDAGQLGLVEWQLRLPSEEEILAAMEKLPANDSDHYLLPRHLDEIDRLDIQHYAMRETLRANYLAPVDDPARVLDVGCGTGQWAFEVCRRFAQALVVGVDLVPGKPDSPPRYRYVKGNLLHGLPFADDQFDFVHQRFLVTGLPFTSWETVIGELSRVTRPGGWVELVEGPWGAERPGPGAQRILSTARPLLEALGLDTSDVVYRSIDGYLRAAGLTNVARHEVEMPIGRWGGQVGSLMVTNIRTGSTRVLEVLQARGALSPEDAWELIQAAQEDWENGRMAYPVAIAFGQKPAG